MTLHEFINISFTLKVFTKGHSGLLYKGSIHNNNLILINEVLINQNEPIGQLGDNIYLGKIHWEHSLCDFTHGFIIMCGCIGMLELYLRILNRYCLVSRRSLSQTNNLLKALNWHVQGQPYFVGVTGLQACTICTGLI